ncbi:MAG: type I pullulanase [Prevotella sp.]|nr:type I pullulanase [Prevotella sp.]
MKRLAFAGMAALILACEPDRNTEFCFDEMTYSPSETVFKLFAPADAECFVVVGDDTLRMSLRSDSIWTATAQGDQKGKTYVFLVNGQVSPGVFAKAVTVNGEKGAIIDLRDTDPEGWSDDVRPVVENPADLVVYEMHHRDFSINRPDAQYKGKFLALTEPWAIDHLTQLGINAVHILPSYDYGSVDEKRLDEPQYNWGYDPVNYNVPEGSYSTDPNEPATRIREFKQMVQALHKAGIRVILDVVYNHTYDIEHSNFQRTYPGYYYRWNEDGSASNGSGCGNETASEQPMMRRFMVESVKYWISEYHIDGFRFDLMGVHDIETMNQIRRSVSQIDPTIFIYGEGWSAGPCALPNEQLGMKANIPQMPGIAAFSDDLRDALRGPFSDDTEPGWLGSPKANAAINSASLKAGIAGMIAHPQVDYSQVNYSKEPYALEPTQMMAYVSCHDDMCLTDRLRASIPGIGEDELIRLDLLAQTAVFTSQGVPFMLSGEELLRTKLGVHNSFESPDSINQLDWTNKTRYPQVFDYYKNLIALRKHHPAFRLGSAERVRQHLEFLPTTDDGVVAYRLKGGVPNEKWGDIIVVLNANRQPAKVSVPQAAYTIVAADGVINEQGIGEPTQPVDEVTVSPQSALIIHE